MRHDFAEYLYELMKENPDIWLITGDLGFGLFDKIREDYPDRFLNTGAAEFSMMDIAVGLALNGKIPVVYSITPFLIYRAFEVIRTYINHESIPVIMIGGGRNDDYKHDGYSHYAGDDKGFMNKFHNISSYWPKSNERAREHLRNAIQDNVPVYINLVR